MQKYYFLNSIKILICDMKTDINHFEQKNAFFFCFNHPQIIIMHQIGLSILDINVFKSN